MVSIRCSRRVFLIKDDHCKITKRLPEHCRQAYPSISINGARVEGGLERGRRGVDLSRGIRARRRYPAEAGVT
jgi:hypothetical protein